MTTTPTATQPTIKLGRYRHYKGNEYEVLGVVRHSETEEWLVLYRLAYGDYSSWVRPFTMFTDQVTYQGQTQPRFALIAD